MTSFIMHKITGISRPRKNVEMSELKPPAKVYDGKWGAGFLITKIYNNGHSIINI
jgi:hypothetical protein